MEAEGSVVEMLLQKLIDEAATHGSQFGLRLLGAFLVLALGVWLVRMLGRPLREMLMRSRLDDTVSTFLGNLISYALLGVVGIGALNTLGVATSSLVALVGAMGFAVGLAMEGSLANFAAGVLIAFFRPFRIGDFVEVADSTGTVEDIAIFYTTLVTLDNETIIIPNSEVSSGKVTNYTARPYVRVEVPLLIAHDADYAEVSALLEAAAEASPRCLAEPPPEIQITDLTDVGVHLQLEVSCTGPDREDVVFEVAEQIKKRFDAAGVRVPRQGMVVHLQQA